MTTQKWVFFILTLMYEVFNEFQKHKQKHNKEYTYLLEGKDKSKSIYIRLYTYKNKKTNKIICRCVLEKNTKGKLYGNVSVDIEKDRIKNFKSFIDLPRYIDENIFTIMKELSNDIKILDINGKKKKQSIEKIQYLLNILINNKDNNINIKLYSYFIEKLRKEKRINKKKIKDAFIVAHLSEKQKPLINVMITYFQYLLEYDETILIDDILYTIRQWIYHSLSQPIEILLPKIIHKQYIKQIFRNKKTKDIYLMYGKEYGCIFIYNNNYTLHKKDKKLLLETTIKSRIGKPVEILKLFDTLNEKLEKVNVDPKFNIKQPPVIYFPKIMSSRTTNGGGPNGYDPNIDDIWPPIASIVLANLHGSDRIRASVVNKDTYQRHIWNGYLHENILSQISKMIIKMSKDFRKEFMTTGFTRHDKFLSTIFKFGEGLCIRCHFYRSFFCMDIKGYPNNLIETNNGNNWTFKCWTKANDEEDDEDEEDEDEEDEDEEDEDEDEEDEDEEDEDEEDEDEDMYKEYRLYRYLLSALTYRPQPPESYVELNEKYNVEKIWNEEGRRLPCFSSSIIIDPKELGQKINWQIDIGERYYDYDIPKNEIRYIETIVPNEEEGRYAFDTFDESEDYYIRQNKVTNNLKNGAGLQIECYKFYSSTNTQQAQIKEYINTQLTELKNILVKTTGSLINNSYQFTFFLHRIYFDVIMLSNPIYIEKPFYFLFDAKYIDIVKRMAEDHEVLHHFSTSTTSPKFIYSKYIKEIFKDKVDKNVLDTLFPDEYITNRTSYIYILKDIVWQCFFGKKLNEGETVVHINGNICDFREENLEIVKK